jgi:hypothetical protein
MSAVLLLLLLLVVIFILLTTIVIVAIMVMMIINHFLRECVSIYIIYTVLYTHVPSRSHETSASPLQNFRSEELPMLPKIAWTKNSQDKLCVALLSCSKVSRRGCTMIHVNNCKHIWVWVNTYRYIFSGMNIHLPAILMFTRGTRF